jgi:FG-GAP-like repeat/ASPIC and UnbV
MKIASICITLLVLVLSISCKKTSKEASEKDRTEAHTETSGTLQMKDSIRKIKENINFRNHMYESEERLKLVEAEVNAANSSGTLTPSLYIEYGKILLEAGRSEDAINVFETILKNLPENKKITATTKALHEALALGYLRLGEQRNCLENHSTASCLFPIKGEGIHTDKNGSQKAIEIYKNILAAFPNDLQSRWLFNIAYMTLGEYPNNVPPSLLIEPSAFHPEYQLPVFENISMYTGTDVNDLAGGVVLDDFNGDGTIDILVSSWGMSGSLTYFLNDGTGNFLENTVSAGLSDMHGGLNLIQADYDNDGDLDFYVQRSAWSGLKSMGILPNSLITNNGDGTYTDTTIDAGMYAAYPTQSAVWVDFNVDGWLDLFVGNETHTDQEPYPAQLFLNNKNGTFTDVAPQLNLDLKTFIKGVTAGDVNNDGLPDIYISNINSENLLFLNHGGSSIKDWRFEEISQNAGVSQPMESFPTWFFDYNNDGYEDLFVSCFDYPSLKRAANEVAADYLKIKPNAKYPKLYKNNGNNTFTDVTTEANLDHVLPTMGCNFGDLDNDGFLDFYLGTGAPDFRSIVPNRMFRNANGDSFQDVTYSGNFGHLQKGHGIAFADLDNDGDQDIYAVMGGSVSGDVFQNALFENPMVNTTSITILLEGTKSNRSAIGARIRVHARQPDGTVKTIHYTVNSGGSFGANSLQAEIGLGDAIAIDTIEVSWPNGKNNYIDYGAVPIEKFTKISIKEGKNKIHKLPTSSFALKKKTHMNH